MKKLLVLILLTFSLFGAYSQDLSDKAKVSILTCGAGAELYAKFGHTAIRISDPVSNIDVVYNYGTFNFRTKNFYLKFVKGITDYELGIDYAVNFFMRYQDNGILVWEQELNLTQAEKEALFHALMLNYEPQNRLYRYNFVYDNCSTRPRDMIEQFVGGELNYPAMDKKDTFRDLIELYTGTNSWEHFGIDLVFGPKSDVIAKDRERMFLPMEYMHYMQSAKRPDGESIVLSKKIVIDLPEKTIDSAIVTPLLASFLLFLIVFLLTYYFRNKCLVWLDILLYTIAGLIGFVLFYLSFYSTHPMVSPNFNLLWLQPLHLLFVILLSFKSLYKYLMYYQIANAVVLVFAVLGYFFLPQKFNITFLPLMLLLLVRSIHFVRMQLVFKTQKPA